MVWVPIASFDNVIARWSNLIFSTERLGTAVVVPFGLALAGLLRTFYNPAKTVIVPHACPN